jgi:hypothetical protein
MHRAVGHMTDSIYTMYVINYLVTVTTVVQYTGLGSVIIFIITRLRPFLFTSCISLS